MEREPRDLEQLLERVGRAEGRAEGADELSIGDVVEELGHRPFGTVLLLAGLVAVAPLVGDVPGVPTLMGVLVLLAGGQLLLRRESLWLPRWLLQRSVARSKVEKVVDKLAGPARAIDRVLRPRLTPLVEGAGAYAVAAACILIALALPPMEFIPFSANLAGAALTAYGLALIARDGLLALGGHLLMAAMGVVVVSQL